MDNHPHDIHRYLHFLVSEQNNFLLHKIATDHKWNPSDLVQQVLPSLNSNPILDDLVFANSSILSHDSLASLPFPPPISSSPPPRPRLLSHHDTVFLAFHDSTSSSTPPNDINRFLNFFLLQQHNLLLHKIATDHNWNPSDLLQHVPPPSSNHSNPILDDVLFANSSKLSEKSFADSIDSQSYPPVFSSPISQPRLLFNNNSLFLAFQS